MTSWPNFCLWLYEKGLWCASSKVHQNVLERAATQVFHSCRTSIHFKRAATQDFHVCRTSNHFKRAATQVFHSCRTSSPIKRAATQDFHICRTLSQKIFYSILINWILSRLTSLKLTRTCVVSSGMSTLLGKSPPVNNSVSKKVNPS